MEDIIPSFCLNHSRSCGNTEKIQFSQSFKGLFLSDAHVAFWSHPSAFLLASLGLRHIPFPSVLEHTQKIPVHGL